LKEQRNLPLLATVGFIQIRPLCTNDQLIEITLHYENRTAYLRKYAVQSADTVGNIING